MPNLKRKLKKALSELKQLRKQKKFNSKDGHYHFVPSEKTHNMEDYIFYEWEENGIRKQNVMPTKA